MEITFFDVDGFPAQMGRRLLVRLTSGNYTFARLTRTGWRDDQSLPVHVLAWAAL